MEKLTNAERAEIDALILAGSIIPAMVRIRNECGVGLPDARDLFRQRYQQLRAEQRAGFKCSDEEYWSCYGEDIFDAIAKGW